MVGEQPYNSRDMVGSDSGLGRLLVSLKKILYRYSRQKTESESSDQTIQNSPKVSTVVACEVINDRKNSTVIVIDSESLMRDVGPLYHTEELQLIMNHDSNTALVKTTILLNVVFGMLN